MSLYTATIARYIEFCVRFVVIVRSPCCVTIALCGICTVRECSELLLSVDVWLVQSSDAGKCSLASLRVPTVRGPWPFLHPQCCLSIQLDTFAHHVRTLNKIPNRSKLVEVIERDNGFSGKCSVKQL